MKQSATTRNKATLVKPIEMTYGFPGELPKATSKNDQTRLFRFFELYAGTGNARKAAIDAGYSDKWARTYSYQWIKRYRPYAEWLQAHVAQVNVEKLAIEQTDVIAQIAAIGMANDFDYLVFERKAKKVHVRRKHLHELTREQMAAIEVHSTGGVKPTLTYKFRDRDGKLFELGKSLGLFNEKVILEHRHRHLHLTADLSKVPMAELEAIEAQFERLLTHEAPDAQSSVPAVRGDQGKDAGAGKANGGSKDERGQDHQQSRRRRTS